MTGIATNTASTSDSLNGVKNGDVTSVAIIDDPSGRSDLSGSDT